ncbi:hypothetical protein HDU96_008505 [Phlyctochytrium bullatum]|nr:hypothetical protein HDU96_008505 [Phlyctochytrium bullatum]
MPISPTTTSPETPAPDKKTTQLFTPPLTVRIGLRDEKELEDAYLNLFPDDDELDLAAFGHSISENNQTFVSTITSSPSDVTQSSSRNVQRRDDRRTREAQELRNPQQFPHVGPAVEALLGSSDAGGPSSVSRGGEEELVRVLDSLERRPLVGPDAGRGAHRVLGGQAAVAAALEPATAVVSYPSPFDAPLGGFAGTATGLSTSLSLPLTKPSPSMPSLSALAQNTAHTVMTSPIAPAFANFSGSASASSVPNTDEAAQPLGTPSQTPLLTALLQQSPVFGSNSVNDALFAPISSLASRRAAEPQTGLNPALQRQQRLASNVAPTGSPLFHTLVGPPTPTTATMRSFGNPLSANANAAVDNLFSPDLAGLGLFTHTPPSAALMPTFAALEASLSSPNPTSPLFDGMILDSAVGGAADGADFALFDSVEPAATPNPPPMVAQALHITTQQHQRKPSSSASLSTFQKQLAAAGLARRLTKRPVPSQADALLAAVAAAKTTAKPATSSFGPLVGATPSMGAPLNDFDDDALSEALFSPQAQLASANCSPAMHPSNDLFGEDPLASLSARPMSAGTPPSATLPMFPPATPMVGAMPSPSTSRLASFPSLSAQAEAAKTIAAILGQQQQPQMDAPMFSPAPPAPLPAPAAAAAPTVEPTVTISVSDLQALLQAVGQSPIVREAATIAERALARAEARITTNPVAAARAPSTSSPAASQWHHASPALDPLASFATPAAPAPLGSFDMPIRGPQSASSTSATLAAALALASANAGNVVTSPLFAPFAGTPAMPTFGTPAQAPLFSAFGTPHVQAPGSAFSTATDLTAGEALFDETDEALFGGLVPEQAEGAAESLFGEVPVVMPAEPEAEPTQAPAVVAKKPRGRKPADPLAAAKPSATTKVTKKPVDASAAASSSSSTAAPVKQRRRPSKLYTCQHCPRTFTRHFNLKTHEATHDPARERPFKCEVCARDFVRIHDLERHRLCHDPQMKKFRCGTCGKAFTRRDALRRHWSAERLGCIPDQEGDESEEDAQE